MPCFQGIPNAIEEGNRVKPSLVQTRKCCFRTVKQQSSCRLLCLGAVLGEEATPVASFLFSSPEQSELSVYHFYFTLAETGLGSLSNKIKFTGEARELTPRLEHLQQSQARFPAPTYDSQPSPGFNSRGADTLF